MTIENLYNSLSSALRETNTPRNDNHIHASTISSFCPRAYCLSQEAGIIYTRGDGIHYTPLLMTFQIGHAIHELVTRLLRSKQILIREESTLKVNYRGSNIIVSGRVDNIVRISPDSTRCCILEVKSISKENIAPRIQSSHPAIGQAPTVNPIAEHEQQVRTYLWQLEKIREVGQLTKDWDMDSSTGFILYVPKEAVGKHPFYLSEVKQSKGFVKDLEESLDSIIEYKNNGTMPNRICMDHRSQFAKNCSFNKSCFSRLEDELILMEETEDVRTEEKPAKRKSKSKSSGKTDSGKPKHRNSRGRGSFSSDLLHRVQVNSEICRRIMDGAGKEKQQEKSSASRSDPSDEEAPFQ